MKLGIVARADKTGLGNQTRNLVKMLNPDKVLVINSKPFNGNKQYFDFFRKYNSYSTQGFPTEKEIKTFLMGLDAVLTCETFYSRAFLRIARMMGVKTYIQYNYEFLDHLIDPRLEKPTKFLSPSFWHHEEMTVKFPGTEYLPPPIDLETYEKIYQANLSRNADKPRFLHSIGKQAIHDRNGTLDLLEALRYTKSDFELVIKYQDADLEVSDPRVVIDNSPQVDERQLYYDFDAMILPRRYAGLCLPMNEALSSGLPVIMTDISPNNRVLPEQWLVKTNKKGSFMTRTETDLYSADPKALAKKIDEFCKNDLITQKELAHKIATENYAMETLKPHYERILEL